jgi:hypothetical protein
MLGIALARGLRQGCGQRGGGRALRVVCRGGRAVCERWAGRRVRWASCARKRRGRGFGFFVGGGGRARRSVCPMRVRGEHLGVSKPRRDKVRPAPVVFIFSPLPLAGRSVGSRPLRLVGRLVGCGRVCLSSREREKKKRLMAGGPSPSAGLLREAQVRRPNSERRPSRWCMYGVGRRAEKKFRRQGRKWAHALKRRGGVASCCTRDVCCGRKGEREAKIPREGVGGGGAGRERGRWVRKERSRCDSTRGRCRCSRSLSWSLVQFKFLHVEVSAGGQVVAAAPPPPARTAPHGHGNPTSPDMPASRTCVIGQMEIVSVVPCYKNNR